MNRLLRTELVRRLTSILFLSEIVGLLLYNYIEIALTTYGFEVDITYFLFDKTAILCICTAANISLQLSQELDNRTVNNKLFCGFRKSTFYKSEVLVGMIEGMLLLLADTASLILFGKFQAYDMDLLHMRFFINLIITLAIISSVAVISTVLSMLINHRILSIFLVMGITLLLLYSGKETVRNLNQPAQTTLFSDDGNMHDNPLYIEGFQRAMHNAHLLASPYAQSYYTYQFLQEEQAEKADNSLILKKIPYHIEFVLFDAIECFLLFVMEFYLFHKRNLQ